MRLTEAAKFSANLSRNLESSSVSLFSLSNQPVEHGAVRLTEGGRGVELHHLPSMHHQHPVTVHDGVDPGDTKTTEGAGGQIQEAGSLKVPEADGRPSTCGRW